MNCTCVVFGSATWSYVKTLGSGLENNVSDVREVTSKHGL